MKKDGFNKKVKVRLLEFDKLIENSRKNVGRLAYTNLYIDITYIEGKFTLNKDYEAYIKYSEEYGMYSEDILIVDDFGNEHRINEIYFMVIK